MTQDRPLLGIALMLSFSAIIPFADAIAKILGQSLPISLIVAVRFLAQSLLLLPLVLWAGRSLRLPASVWALITARAALNILGIGSMVAALRVLPLADAIAIAFVLPFLMLLLGKYVLGEEVGPRRLIACIVGFSGTLLIIQPSFEQVGWPALLPLGVAVIFALYILITRAISKQVDPVDLQFLSGSIALTLVVPALGLYLLLWNPAPFPQPDPQQWQLLGLMAVIGTLGHLLMTWSLRYAPSTTLAPIQYVELPMTTFVGWLIFADLPDGLAAIGILISLSAGLYIIWRERATLAQS